MLESFAEVTDDANYTPLPNGWHVVITDVVNSTIAIQEGRYKEVNTVGASTLIAVFNAIGGRDIPFVFGGDGATLAVPEELLEAVRPALLGTRDMAREGFGLELRVGLVPVELIRQAGHEVKVARVRLSRHFNLAAFTGGGLAHAEKLVKDPGAGRPFRLEGGEVRARANFSGLECRWNGIPSDRGEMLAVLVSAATGDPMRDGEVYREVLAAIDEIFEREGKGEGGDNPLEPTNLVLALNPGLLMGECRVKFPRAPRWLRGLVAHWMKWETWVGRLLMDRQVNLPGLRWRGYKDDILRNSDYQKFDEMLRLVLSSDPDQHRRLEEFLEARFQRRELAYGLHAAREALMTCLIFERQGGHLHFIDGADGGYAMAAVGLKRRLKELGAGG